MKKKLKLFIATIIVMSQILHSLVAYAAVVEINLYAQWEEDVYSITYNSNGSSSTAPTDNKEYSYNEQVTVLSAIPRTGYTFKGWGTTATGGTVYTTGNTFNILQNTTLFAQWEADTYTVTYHSNGSSNAAPSDGESYNYGDPATVLSGITKTGYNFTGWNTLSTGLGSTYQPDSTLEVNGNVSLYAMWTAKTSIVVTFNTNGGGTPSTSQKNVTFDNAYGELATIDRDGYIFDGWFTSSVGGTEVTATTTVNNESNHNLYAQWTRKNYTVTYNSNGSSAVAPADTNTYGYEAEITVLGVIARDGYTFKGWGTTSTGGTVYKAGDKFDIYDDVILYAQWEENTYIITYHSNGSSNEPPVDSSIYNYSSTVRIKGIMLRPGYTFSGWTTSPDGTGTVYSANQDINISDLLK